MIYTNKFNLPDAFKRSVEADPYDNKGTYSPSVLNNPPRATVLRERFGDKFEVDISSRVAATLGQGAHSILERGARPHIDIVEKRFVQTIKIGKEVYKVSAQIDLYESDTKTLSDWKTTKAYAFHKKTGNGKKPEWTSQLSVGRWCMHPDLEVKHAQIVGLLKDWSPDKAAVDPGYPQTEIVTAQVKVWSLEDTELWIKKRISKILEARDVLPFCDSKETWYGKRCARWCDSSQVCTQYQSGIKTGIMKQEEKAEVW